MLSAAKIIYTFKCTREAFAVDLHKEIDTTLINTPFSRISQAIGEDLLKKLRIMPFSHVRMAPEANDKHTKKKVDNL